MVAAMVEAGNRETVTLNLVPGGGTNESFIFTVVAYDDDGNMGEDGGWV